MEENRKIVDKIIDEFEDLLNKNEIKIPNKERENYQQEACIYGSDYYNLEYKIMEILENYIKDKYIKNKLKLWIKNIKKEKDINKAIRDFEDLFKNDCEPIYIEEVDEYFESYLEKYELNNNIVVEKSWGDWDKFGDQVSHIGTDITIYFQESEKEKNRKGITIFFANKYQNNIGKLEEMLKEETLC